jgi:PAS domain S-box-containing protein
MLRLARFAARSLSRRGVSYRALFNLALEAIMFLDAESGVVVDANPAACALYGYSTEELIGTSMLSRCRSEERVFDPIADLRGGGVPMRHFFMVDYRRDGTELYLEVNASIVRHRGRRLVLAFHRDMTQKTMMARKLAEAGGDWQLSIDSIQEAILLVESSGRVIRVNEMAANLMGDPPRTGGRHLSDFGSTEPWRRAAELVAFVAEHGSALSSQVDEVFSGATWDVAATPATSASGERRVILVMRDVTLMASMEASLRRSESMAEMGRLVSGVAHEVRNPLFTISATLDAFEKRMVASAVTLAEPYLQHLREAIERLSTLMRELLELGKPSLMQVSTESLMNPIGDAITDVAPLAARKNVTIVNRVTPESAKILMDRSKLAQALSNLLDNAIHHSPVGEEILISAQRKQTMGQTWVLCSIEDRGGGFAEADLPRVFEPFFTKRKGGTGLGLPIVQRIVQHHGGRVIAENRSGGGACITVMIPHLVDGEEG